MKTYIAISCFLAFAAITTANPPAVLSYMPITTIDKISDPSYKFNYAVNDPVTGDNKGQWETRHGDVVHGAYSLVEPDGNVRIVEYTADPLRGFNAVVKRTGPNIHSVSLPVVEPIAPVITKPIVAPVIHETIAPIAQVAPIIDHVAPIIDHVAPIPDVASVYHGPIIHHPIVHGPLIEPLIEAAPLITPLNILPMHLPAPSPWVTFTGTKYGEKGNIVRRWAAGPFSLDGKTVTMKTKH